MIDTTQSISGIDGLSEEDSSILKRILSPYWPNTVLIVIKMEASRPLRWTIGQMWMLEQS